MAKRATSNAAHRALFALWGVATGIAFLLFSSKPTGADELGIGNRLVLTAEVDGTPFPGDKFKPQWSPDLGKQCSRFGDYICFEYKADQNTAKQIYLYRFKASASSGPSPLSETIYPLIDIASVSDPTVDREDPQWSPDGNWILFTKKVGSHTQIFRAALRTSGAAGAPFSTEIQITSGATNHRNARWSPSSSVNLIVFERDVAGLPRIFKQCPTCIGGLPIQVTSDGPSKGDRNPRWNRASTHVVFERDLDTNEFTTALFTTAITNPSPLLLAASGGAQGVIDRDARWFEDDPTLAELHPVIVFERKIGADSHIHEVTWNPALTQSPVNLPTTSLTQTDPSFSHTSPRIDGIVASRVVYIRSDGELRKIARLESPVEIERIDEGVAGLPEISNYGNNVTFEVVVGTATEIAIFDTAE